MSIIADRCGHFGCSDSCIDDYDIHIPLKGCPDIEVSEEGWKFLEDDEE